MIAGKDVYQVLAALVPLYVAMVLAYGSVRWWKIFTPEQCTGINRFVAVFATPFLSFHFICSNNPYKMNLRFIAADSLQKVMILVILFVWQAITRRGELDWTITLFSLCTLPNTLVMGVPLLKSMYGEFTSPLMVQIVFLQSAIWYTLMLFMFEYRGAKRLIAEKFPETAASISSFKVDSDVVSLSGNEPLETDAEIRDDGKLHVVVRRSSTTSAVFSSYDRFDGMNSIFNVIPPKASNFSGVEVFSVQSSIEPTPRASSFSQTNFPELTNATNSYGDIYSVQSSRNSEPWIPSNFEEEMKRKNGAVFPGSTSGTSPNKELHMFVWSSSVSSNRSDRYLRPDEIDGKVPTNSDSLVIDSSNGAALQRDNIIAASTAKKQQMPPATVMSRLIIIMVWRKLVRNPNSYASLLGLIWSLISFRWNIKMPLIVSGSVNILSNTGLGMAMFSLGPGVIAATSLAIGLRGVLLRVAIIQGALPLGIVPFIFAKEYSLHANLLSTA
ncbi:unnamed protein product [Dovyalis caffra]|uniref:Auxin efflux carrier component n=1 Tax=Dovyalis caffra TaxID=77055 RepID=A0AAV1STI7_9ROSI|nr:unnamed protein product [Dovyalis caffra]